MNLKKINETDVEFGEFIGKGTFGEVVAGNLKLDNQASIKVAIKKLKNVTDELEINDFLKESIFLNSLNHQNIIKFNGICFENNNFNRPKFIAIEYMNRGDLLRFIRDNKITFEKAVYICLNIARACRYLEEIELVHRYLKKEKENKIILFNDYS